MGEEKCKMIQWTTRENAVIISSEVNNVPFRCVFSKERVLFKIMSKRKRFPKKSLKRETKVGVGKDSYVRELFSGSQPSLGAIWEMMWKPKGFHLKFMFERSKAVHCAIILVDDGALV